MLLMKKLIDKIKNHKWTTYQIMLVFILSLLVYFIPTFIVLGRVANGHLEEKATVITAVVQAALLVGGFVTGMTLTSPKK